MDRYTATELAYKHGYEKGYEAGKMFATENNVGCKWIPVSERLPEDDDPVLACDVRDDFVECLCYCDGLWYSEEYRLSLDSITHWMPLPELPKEGE